MGDSGKKSGGKSAGGEDDRLWQRVARSVTPLGAGRRGGRVAAPAPSGARRAPGRNRPDDLSGPETDPRAGAPRALARSSVNSRERDPARDIPERDRQRIASGRRPIDARIDLHGLTLNGAHRRLDEALAAAARAGKRRVLVITGIGGRGEARGALNREVPQWLRAGALGHLVSEISPASRRHGGEGALYVVLKRQR